MDSVNWEDVDHIMGIIWEGERAATSALSYSALKRARNEGWPEEAQALLDDLEKTAREILKYYRR